MNDASVHAFTLVVVVNKALALLARRIAKYTAHAAEEEYDYKSPHATSYACALSFYFGWPFITTRRASMFKRSFTSPLP